MAGLDIILEPEICIKRLDELSMIMVEVSDQYKDLLSLQGVGVYTASAIASICFNRPKAVVDGMSTGLESVIWGK